MKIILYHITSIKNYKKIMKEGVIKPGPRNVWVDRKPVGYIRKGGAVWLCTKSKVKMYKAHLQRQGKPAEIAICLCLDTDKNRLCRFNPFTGVYFTRSPIEL